MHTVWLGVLISALAGGATWGWGWAACRVLRVAPPSLPLTLGVGLATLLCLGGLLNLTGAVQPRVLDAVLVAGLLFAAGGCSIARRELKVWRPTRAVVAAAVPLIVVAAGAFAYWMPPEVFNVHDDFEKYFAHPLRMLAHGTLKPNPLASVGAETLGGQAFLQTFLLAHLPVAYIGVVDAVLGLLLAVALACLALKPTGSGLASLAAGVCMLAINPQVVNTSSVFTGVALMLTAVLLPGAPGGRLSGALLGLVYAALLSLKTTHAAFVGLHALALIASGAMFGYRWWRPALAAVAWLVVFVSPWMLLHLPLYLAAPAAEEVRLIATIRPAVDLLSPVLNGYGSSLLHYTVLGAVVLMGAIAAVVASWQGWIRTSAATAALVAAGATAGAGYFILMLIGAPLFLGPLGAARYATPMFLAVIPAMLRLGETMTMGARRGIWPAAALATAAVAVAGFWPSIVSRVREMREARTPLVYLADAAPADRAEFFSYNRQVLTGPTRSNLRAIQEFVPPGERLGAWVMAPFHLDFDRNDVLTVDPAGLTMRWVQLPADVHYFLLQHGGYSVRSMAYFADSARTGPSVGDRMVAARSVAFLETLRTKASRWRILYDDGTYVLMRSRPP